MAFTGTATTTSLGSRSVRITGLSLLASATGTISANGGAGEVTLPSTFPTFDSDYLQVIVNQVAAGGAISAVYVAKAGDPVIITIGNTDAVNATAGLEIWVRQIHSVTA